MGSKHSRDQCHYCTAAVLCADNVSHAEQTAYITSVTVIPRKNSHLLIFTELNQSFPVYTGFAEGTSDDPTHPSARIAPYSSLKASSKFLVRFGNAA